MTKNALQEWLQKRRLPLPVYETKIISGEDHRPVFSSTVTLQNRKIEGEKCSRKIDAEQSAASIALALLVMEGGIQATGRIIELLDSMPVHKEEEEEDVLKHQLDECFESLTLESKKQLVKIARGLVKN